MNHSGPFADRGDANVLFELARTVDLDSVTSNRANAVFSTVSVVRMACATCWKWSDLRSERCGELRQGGDELFRRQGNADDAGGGGEDLFWPAGKCLGGCAAGGAGRIEPGLTGGAVGVARIDGDDADLAASGAQVLFVDDKRSGFDAVGR